MRAGRWSELALLVFAVLFLAVGVVELALTQNLPVAQAAWGPCLIFALALLALHGFLAWRWARADQLLVPTSAMLSALGLVMIARLEPALFGRQALWIALGATALIATLTLLPSLEWLAQYKYTWAALGCALILATFVFGVDLNGSGMRWWLGAGGVYFQPSEVFKVLLVIFVASYLAEKRELITLAGPRLGPWQLPALPYLVPLLIMVLLALGLVVAHTELGAALLYFGLFLALLYVATGQARFVVTGLAAFAVGSLAAYRLFGHVRDRVAIWLDPWADAQGRGYQVVQALIALGAGGVLGSGLGYGYPEYIPAVYTDFIIAAIGEELGLLGTLGLVMLYLLLVYRGYRIALRAPDAYLQLLATGLSTVLALQALVILGGTTRLLPLTGIPLPFVSYGGSALLANFVLLGLLLRISAETPEQAPRRA
ncbi:MAG TPA: FtsW/RodA/SpoVE family cell cycle protein [Chloroflexota bacterium]|nr:FtsW/RodA/SpoVE family cell cycle protein [Chloroflexota bacterium]